MSQALEERRASKEPERWEPLRELEQLNERMRTMLEQTFGGLAPLDRDGWAPLVDIEELDDAYVVEADIPGVKKDDVNIEQVGNELVVTGEIKERKRDGALRRRTRRVGRFAFRVMLPERVEGDKIEAKLDNGVLAIRVPKAQRAERRRVQVS
ncbi:MAG TPA: Hsp20/alpha crystallin family protein [Gaiellaceae bacterium]|jgi:HSP20 family protein